MIKKYWSQIALIIIIIILYSFFKGCSNPFAKVDTNDVTKKDSTKVRVIIPTKTFTQEDKRPINNYYSSAPSQDTQLQTVLIQLMNQNKLSNENNKKFREETKKQMDLLLKALDRKEYTKTYSNDTVAEVVVFNIVEDGKKIYEKVDVKVKESFLDYYKTETTTLKYPDLTISTGFGITAVLGSPLEFNDQMLQNIEVPSQFVLSGILGVKNKKGNQLSIEVGINKDLKLKTVSAKYTKDIFTKFGIKGTVELKNNK